MDRRAAVWAGIIAGAIFLILEMIMVPLFLGGSVWDAPRMIAGIVLGERAVMPGGFGVGAFIVALIVHFLLSVIYALILAWIVHRWSLVPALVAGAVFGLVLYLVNFYGFTAAFPWFAMARNWVSVFAHISFGIGAAWAYKVLERTQPVTAPGGGPPVGGPTGGAPPPA